jgi:hypothetical protein
MIEILVGSSNIQWTEVSRISEAAMKLLPNISPRAVRQAEIQHSLATCIGLPTLAAGAALQAKESEVHALGLLEHGRGIIAGLKLGLRENLSLLRSQHQEMALKLERLIDILEAPAPAIMTSTSLTSDHEQ